MCIRDRREEVNAILKEIKDAVPKVSVDELKDTSKRKLAMDEEKVESIPKSGED